MLNKVIIMGRLTADPELKQISSGVSVTSFRVAVERNYVPQGGERQADFINVVAWKGTAEHVARWFSKGRMICVEGSLQTRQYVDKTGANRTATEVIAENVYFTGEKAQDSGNSFQQNRNSYNNSYNNQNSYSQNNYQQAAPTNSGTPVSDLSDFEEVLSDENVPF